MAIGLDQVELNIQKFNEKYKFSFKANDFIDVFTTSDDPNYMYALY